MFAVMDARKQKISQEFKTAITDSFDFKGKLIDMNFGGTCGQGRMAGVFIFKLLASDRKNLKDTIAVVIQCAAGRYENLLIKNENYIIKVTPIHFRTWVNLIWTKYEYLDRYYIMHDFSFTRTD